MSWQAISKTACLLSLLPATGGNFPYPGSFGWRTVFLWLADGFWRKEGFLSRGKNCRQRVCRNGNPLPALCQTWQHGRALSGWGRSPLVIQQVHLFVLCHHFGELSARSVLLLCTLCALALCFSTLCTRNRNLALPALSERTATGRQCDVTPQSLRVTRSGELANRMRACVVRCVPLQSCDALACHGARV